MDNSFEQPITLVALIALVYVFCKALSSKRNGKRRANAWWADGLENRWFFVYSRAHMLRIGICCNSGLEHVICQGS